MSSGDIALKAENISKLYRIGLKDNIHDSIGGAILDFIKSPVKNYLKYRSLYKFDDVVGSPEQDSGNNLSDIIWALKKISFEVKRGEILGLIGRNGAGKSTLLKILSKITHPTSGRAVIRGRVSSLLEVGTGFHQELTGRENVYLNGTILGMTKKEVDRKFDEIVDFSGVEKFIDTPVKRYSSGMKVRLAFAVAGHLEPEILLVDEVLAVGDASFQKKCINKMQDIGQEGRTIIFVSHNMHAISYLCERIVLLDEGRVRMDGPSQKVVAAYLSRESGTRAAYEWNDPANLPGGDVARLLAVRVRTEDGRVSEAFDIRKPIAIEMEYEVLKPGHTLLCHFHFDNHQGVRIFSTHDSDPEWRRRVRPTGRYVSTAWIPGNLLAEGLHHAHAGIISLEPLNDQCWVREAVAFQVFDSVDGDSARGDWTREMRGVVRPLLKWTTLFTPEVS
jgi:lipopolysaccharide transport system ATP-binding protein